MQPQRQGKRMEVDIPITVITVLETMEGSIVDLNEQGAQIHGVSLPAGARFRIEYRGQTVFAQSRWSEVDRMGAKFLFELAEGPLYERLLMAQATQPGADLPSGIHMPPIAQGQTRTGARTFARAMPGGSFGRRG